MPMPWFDFVLECVLNILYLDLNVDIKKLITYISKIFPDPDTSYLDYSENFQDQLVYFYSEVYDNWEFLRRRLLFKVQRLDKSIARYDALGFKFTLNELKPFVLDRELNPFIWNKFFILDLSK